MRGVTGLSIGGFGIAVALFAATPAAVASTQVTAAPRTISADPEDGTCNTGEICLYYSEKQKGSLYDTDTNNPYLTVEEFLSPGKGEGYAVGGNTESYRNKSDDDWCVYSQYKYHGKSYRIEAGTKGNFNNYWDDHVYSVKSC